MFWILGSFGLNESTPELQLVYIYLLLLAYFELKCANDTLSILHSRCVAGFPGFVPTVWIRGFVGFTGNWKSKVGHTPQFIRYEFLIPFGW